MCIVVVVVVIVAPASEFAPNVRIIKYVYFVLFSSCYFCCFPAQSVCVFLFMLLFVFSSVVRLSTGPWFLHSLTHAYARARVGNGGDLFCIFVCFSCFSTPNPRGTLTHPHNHTKDVTQLPYVYPHETPVDTESFSLNSFHQLWPDNLPKPLSCRSFSPQFN